MASASSVAHTTSLIVVDESQLDQFATEFEPYQPIDQASPGDDSQLPTVDLDDSQEYNLTNGREIVNDFNLEIGRTFHFT